MDSPQKWTDVFPYGTPAGDEESRFFKVLARSKSEWVTGSQIIKGSGLTRSRMEEILEKYAYMKPPLIFAHETNEDTWAYWVRVPELLEKLQANNTPVSNKDKIARVDKLTGKIDVTAKTETVADENNWALDI